MYFKASARDMRRVAGGKPSKPSGGRNFLLAEKQKIPRLARGLLRATRDDSIVVIPSVSE
jgi:hypothetical protein